MPPYKKSAGRSAHHKSRAVADEAGRNKSANSDDYVMESDGEFERKQNEINAKLGLPPLDFDNDTSPTPPNKRKRVPTAKARAALEADPPSDGSVEPLPKKKTVSRSKKLVTSTPKRRAGNPPPGAHPASLVRLKSPVQLQSSRPTPPKVKRKYESYSDAVSQGSASSDEEETLSSQEEGSIADFIDDRAEDELSVDSAESVEDPAIRKSRLSKKRGAARPKASESTTAHRRKDARHTRQNDSNVTQVPDTIVISDDSDNGHRKSQARAAPRGSKASGRNKGTEFIQDDDEDQPAVSSSKTSSARHRQSHRDAGERQKKGRTSRGPSRLSKGKKTAAKYLDSKRRRTNTHSANDDRSFLSSERNHDESVSSTHRNAAGEPDCATDTDIDWPSTPEHSAKKRSNKEYCGGDEEGKVTDPPAGKKLLQGQDVFLAGTYGSMEPLKSVELVPLFGSQDPPEEEGLKLSDLLKLYESGPASRYLAKRLRQVTLFQQQGVLVNPSRAKLNKVTTSSYGSSTYFVMPTTIVQPRNGALPFYACFIITGVCAYCYLFRPASKTLQTRSITDHRIGLYPIEYEYQRGLTYLGNVSRKSSLRYSFTSGILAFTSKTEGSSESNNANFGASPVKSAFHRDRAVPAAQSSSGNPVLENLRTSRFPAALSYSDQVPIFDARGTNFLTGPFDLSLIHTLPLLNGDVDESSIVTVGYTSNTYVSTTGSLAGADLLSMNVQFVILHAGPPA
ncbi:hypothetical protein NMY22_g8224 [Coprinellus aureogranulatus]|nr:hypothetical protein NMY22_g8224 [Coprinellus aureogranulatus]